MLGVVIGLELFSRTVLPLINAGAIYMIVVAYVAVTGGRRTALLTALIGFIGNVLLFATPQFSFQYIPANLLRLFVNAFALLTLALLAGGAKARSDRLLAERVASETARYEQERAQEVLRASEERLRLANEAAQIGTWNFFPQTGVFEWDAACRKLHGIAPDRPMSYDLWEASLHPDDKERVVEARRDAIAGLAPYQLEYRTVGVDISKLHWLYVRGQLHKDASGKPVRFLGIAQDITEREQSAQFLQDSLTALSESLEAQGRAQAALQVSEARARRVTDSGMVAIIHWNLATGKITDANDAFLTLTGYEKGDVVSGVLDLRVITPPEWRNQGHESRDTLTQNRYTPSYEKEYFHKNGRRIPVLMGSALFDDSEVEGVSFVLDMTARKALEDERDRMLEQQKRIAETLQRSLLIDTPNGAFPGLDTATWYEPARADALVGGDFYDSFALHGGKVAFVVGDATGKGLQAATQTAEVKFALRAFLRENADVGAALSRLNGFVLASQAFDGRASDALICVALAVVEPATGVTHVAAAGMEPPLFLPHGGVPEALEKAGGPIIGMGENASFDTESVVLSSGDVLLLASDGITEARQKGAGRAFFGYDGFARSAQTALQAFAEPGDAALKRGGEQIVSDARHFGGGTLTDDVCLLLVRLREKEL